MISQTISPARNSASTSAASRPIATAAIVALLLLLSTAPLFAVADLPGEARGTLAAVFPPGTDRTQALTAVARADGLVVRGGGWGAVLVAHSDEAGFAQRLRQAGAWLVVDPRSAAGCLIVGSVNTRFES